VFLKIDNILCTARRAKRKKKFMQTKVYKFTDKIFCTCFEAENNCEGAEKNLSSP